MISLRELLVDPVTKLLDNPEMMHAAAVHMPVAIAVIGLPIALAALVPARISLSIRWAGVVCYSLLMIVAYVATRTGEDALALVPSTLPAYMWSDINDHESMAERVWIFGGVTAGLFLLSVIKIPSVRWTASILASVASAATLGWVIQVGHHGGTLVYEHGLGTPPLYIETHRYQAFVEDMTEGLSQEDAAAAAEAGNPEQERHAKRKAYNFSRDILPVLQDYCTDCHSPGELEGGLDLTTVKGMLTGGEKSGPALHVGKPGKSPLILYIRGERQPQMPKGEPVLSESNTQMLADWVAGLTPGKLEEEFDLMASDTTVTDKGGAETGFANPLLKQLNTFIGLELAYAAVAEKKKEVTGPRDETLGAGIQNYEQEYARRQERIRRARLGIEESDAARPVDRAVARENTIMDHPRPDFDQRDALKDLRFALIAEHPPSESTVRRARSHHIDSYTLVEPDAYRRLQRDLRKQWLPAERDLPKGDALQNSIDDFIDAKLVRAGLTEKLERCDDSAFVRRAYLDLHGVVPTAEEARAFLNDSSSDKRASLIDTLLGQDEDYAANWVPFWEDALCSTHRNPNISAYGKHGDYREWIFDSFQENKPYDVWIRQLLNPLIQDHPQSYILRRTQMDLLQSAANTAQVFLGTAMKCASCHNDFSNPEWTQSRFYSFASFMNPDDMEVIRCEKATGRFVPAKFPWDIPGKNIEAPRKGPFAHPALRMSMFAELLTDPNNPRFAPTIVNRLWKRFIGIGLFEPADDFRLGETLISHPELLDWLANDLIEHDYDLKYAVRQIMMSDTYQRKYAPHLEDEFTLNDPDRPRFYRSPSLRRLWAEQILDSTNQALGVPWQGYARTYWDDEVTPLMAALGRPTSRDEVSTDRVGGGAILMGLELINSPEYHARIYDGPAIKELAGRWGEGASTNEIVSEIYMSVLSREPREAELDLATKFLNPDPPLRDEDFEAPKPPSLGKGEGVTAKVEPGIAKRTLLGDMYWALFTSPEFQYIR